MRPRSSSTAASSVYLFFLRAAQHAALTFVAVFDVGIDVFFEAKPFEVALQALALLEVVRVHESPRYQRRSAGATHHTRPQKARQHSRKNMLSLVALLVASCNCQELMTFTADQVAIACVCVCVCVCVCIRMLVLVVDQRNRPSTCLSWWRCRAGRALARRSCRRRPKRAHSAATTRRRQPQCSCRAAKRGRRLRRALTASTT